MNRPLERSIQVNCPVERAFTLFVTRLNDWWPKSHRPSATSELSLEPFVGGRILARIGDADVKLMGEVLVYEPPSLLIYTWYPGALDRPTRVEVRFKPTDDGSLVEVIHSEGDSGLSEKWDERVKSFIKGWSAVLPAFAEFAEDSSV